ncbi:hypothetical protein RRG08_022244 [Elysia crispata]|uniref:Uncharacterized protein n=1 Tax=Elysia crispata TaxID=231223 RepID=A0AAE0ZS01_9GAST|nr:hypothetical protein RRG08_022244 [Elysia crispata]
MKRHTPVEGDLRFSEPGCRPAALIRVIPSGLAIMSYDRTAEGEYNHSDHTDSLAGNPESRKTSGGAETGKRKEDTVSTTPMNEIPMGTEYRLLIPTLPRAEENCGFHGNGRVRYLLCTNTFEWVVFLPFTIAPVNLIPFSSELTIAAQGACQQGIPTWCSQLDTSLSPPSGHSFPHEDTGQSFIPAVMGLTSPSCLE